MLAVVGLLVGTTTLSMAASKPLWHDEIYTVLLARLGSADLWTATRSGVDLSPPLNTWLTHVTTSAGGADLIPIRLAPLVGFWLAVAVSFEFVRRRANSAMGAVAALLPCFTAGYRYSYEARGYGLMMGLAALSLFAWAEAAAGRRRGLYVPVLGISLAAGYWNQYYALFAVAPLAAAELMRTVQHRRVDRAIWAAIACSFLALVPLFPVMRAAASAAPTFWRKAAWSDVGDTYVFLFSSLVEWPIAGAVSAALLAGVAARAFWRPRGTRMNCPRSEIVALAVYVGLPAVQVTAALATTGVFVPRYALLAVPGVSMALALVLHRITRPVRVAQLGLAAALAVTLAATVPLRPSFSSPARQRPALMQLLAEGKRVAVSGGLMYLQLWYYTPPSMRERLYYVADPAVALAYTGSNTIDAGLLGLSGWSQANVVEREQFLASQPAFTVYGAGSGWLIDWLRDQRMPVEQIGVELGAPILAVQATRHRNPS